MTNIEYSILPTNINSHLFSVTVKFPSEIDSHYTLSLPAWLPGSYMIRDFSKNILELKAFGADDSAVVLEKIDKQTWKMKANSKVTTVKYDVFAFDLSVRTAYLDSQRGFFNGSSTFLSVDELTTSKCTLQILPPANIPNWKVATGLTRSNTTEKYSFGEYHADNYQALIDGPVAIGDFDSFEFTVEGVVHHMVFTSSHFGDRERISRDVAKLCQHHINLFGEVPFKEYWFITHLLEKGFGGLEHKNSTILQASRFDLPNPNKPEELTEEYKTFLSLCSHEYFHAWNVCRIKPKEFIPYNLQEEVYTEQLWAYEGITSYYDDFSLYRAGIISFNDYLAILSKAATRVNRGLGQHKQSVAESSFYTWNKFYKQGADAVNNIVSYYVKGSLIALWLDLTIREKSNGTYSLDNLMRELWIHFGRPEQGTSQEDFINIANILCGEDISKQLLALIEHTEKIELTKLLDNVGVDFQTVKFKKLHDVETIASTDYIPYIGASYKDANIGVKITQVIEGSPAANAGLAVNDLLVAVNSLKASTKSLQSLADHLAPNTSVTCDYFRDDQLISGQLTFIDSPQVGIQLLVSNNEKVEKWQKIVK